MELENDPLVGPPPPTVVAEAAFANDAERFEEVILNWLPREQLPLVLIFAEL